ncbi:hypothetical protein DNTS_008390 [Danionella cerebrum]|uniref:CCD97-like C-terminal domain-containing protein n=1 Tax=Danionella cerebrum TaxID=2873325 RepID=A0A553N0V6_9TELE|nr:hypothetical protein DNTS_008390 [Danionella translucida]
MWGEIEPCVKVQLDGDVSTCETGQRWAVEEAQQKTLMWGEIQTCDKPETSTCSDPAPQDKMVPEAIANGEQDQTSCSSDLTEESSTCLSSMIETIVASGSPVKSQQMGEPDLTLEEKKKLLLEQYRSKPLVFLERYQGHLKPEHTEAFSHLRNDCRAQHYCTEIERRASGTAHRKKVRNQRYAALRALQKGGQYFSEEEMRVREPLLYEQYIGQYLNEEEILQRSQEAMSRCPGTLTDLLISSYQEKLLQSRLEHEQETEESATQESEEEEEDEGRAEPGQTEWEPSAEEKVLLREEFLSQMHQRFLDGKDDFNYSEVDNNPDYDNLDIVNRDAEERYFDDDDEEEEEEDMMQ